MQNIQDYLNENFLGLKYKNAIYNQRTNTLCVCFLYSPALFSLESDDVERLKTSLKNELKIANIDLKFEKSVINNEVIASHLYVDIKNKMPTLARTLNMVDINVKNVGVNDISVTIALPDNIRKFAEETNKAQEIKTM